MDIRIGCQAYSFNRFTFFEAIEKNASLGLTCIEAYPGQVLAPDRRDTKFDHNLSADLVEKVREWLGVAGVKLVNYGVVNLPPDAEECRKVFDFARTMGIETIVSEPPGEALELIDRLCQEYRIHVAFHNHPQPSRYWNPSAVVKACEGRSKYFGACADTGHWVRSGVSPLEAMKRLEGRIVSLHLKDVDRCAPDAEDVPWGTGVGEIGAVLGEIRRQGIHPVIAIEYELSTPGDPSPEIEKCIGFFNETWKKCARE